MKQKTGFFVGAAVVAVAGVVWLFASKTVEVEITLPEPAAATSASSPGTQAAIPPPDLYNSKDGKQVRDRVINLPGYYYPVTDEVIAGKFRLDVVALGASAQFDEFELKGQTIPTWTPAMLVFEDMTSEEIVGDNGVHRENSPRSFCKSYRITREALHLECHDRQVGKVTFSGSINSEFVAAQTLENGRAAIYGDVTVGDKVFRDVGFRYWAGD